MYFSIAEDSLRWLDTFEPPSNARMALDRIDETKKLEAKVAEAESKKGKKSKKAKKDQEEG